MERRSSSESQQIQLATESGRANIATGEVLTVDLDEDSEIDSEDDNVILVERATKKSSKKRKKYSTNNNESLAHDDPLEMADINEANNANLIRGRDTAVTEMKLKREVDENR